MRKSIEGTLPSNVLNNFVNCIEKQQKTNEMLIEKCVHNKGILFGYYPLSATLWK